MNIKFLVGLVTGFAVALVVAVSANQKPPTIESCASLLPDGQNFQVLIEGNIDTADDHRVFEGHFELSDEQHGQSPDEQLAAEPFVACVSALLK